MSKLLKNIDRDDRGFTLMELLIVVAIPGIPAGIVLPGITGLAAEEESGAARAELTIMRSAMDMMMAKIGLSSVTATADIDNMSAFTASNGLYPL